jgi:hypothetical protein
MSRPTGEIVGSTKMQVEISRNVGIFVFAKVLPRTNEVMDAPARRRLERGGDMQEAVSESRDRFFKKILS